MNKLYILCGIPFSGKSTLAKEIINRPEYIRIDLDDVKFDLYGSSVKDSDLKQKDWDIIYKKMYGMIEDFLKQGKFVVHDTGNFTKHERRLVRQIADKLKLQTITIFVDVPKSIAYERLMLNRTSKNRFDVNDEEFESAVNEMEPPTKEENFLVFNVEDDLNSWIHKYFD